LSGYRVERVDPAPHLERLHGILQATRPAPLSEAWLRWRYLDNPDGPAATWVLRAPDGELAGFTVCLPRRWLARGRPLRAWIGADFSMLPRYRTLGLALRLRRAAREAIDAGEADLLVSFPNEKMATIHRQAGHARLGALTRLARPVAAAAYLARAVRPRALAATVAPLADLALRALEALPRLRSSNLTVGPAQRAVFDDRFDALFAAAAPHHGPLGVRDARHLHWRFGAAPGPPHGVLPASRGAALAGYAIFVAQAGLLHLVDALADAPEVYRQLFAALAPEARRHGATAASATLVAGAALVPPLNTLGYRPREERAELYGYLPERLRPDLPSDAAAWHLTIGDRDL
jgi:hypothetical protein